MFLPCADARYTTIAAISSGVCQLPSGTTLRIFSLAQSSYDCFLSSGCRRVHAFQFEVPERKAELARADADGVDEMIDAAEFALELHRGLLHGVVAGDVANAHTCANAEFPDQRLSNFDNRFFTIEERDVRPFAREFP